MRVLVTGATGLIGSHVAARLLAKGHEVRVLVRDEAKLERVLAPFEIDAQRLDVRRGDVLEPPRVTAAVADCDAAVHCAGVFSHDLHAAERLRRVNVGGTETVLSAAAAAGLDPIVHLSSILAIFHPAAPRVRATDPVAEPRAMYSRTKADHDWRSNPLTPPAAAGSW